jgi:hypothetical protein
MNDAFETTASDHHPASNDVDAAQRTRLRAGQEDTRGNQQESQFDTEA